MSDFFAQHTSLFIWTIIVSIGLATFGLRYFPVALLARLELPGWLKRALVYVPPAVLTAIITPALFFPGSTPTISPDIPRIVAAALAAIVAWRTRSVLWTVTLGMFFLWGLQALVR